MTVDVVLAECVFQDKYSAQGSTGRIKKEKSTKEKVADVKIYLPHPYKIPEIAVNAYK